MRDGAALPLVAAYDELPDAQINSVITDNREAAHRAVRHLTDLGHTRIAHLHGPSRNTSQIGQSALSSALLSASRSVAASTSFFLITLPPGAVTLLIL